MNEDFVPLIITDKNISQIENAGWSIEKSERRVEYRSDWTEWHGLREFVQNALDETGAVELKYEDEVGYIIDNGAGFKKEHMLLGEVKSHDERSVQCLRGFFGEGMKIAVHPFLRNKKRVFIRTVGHDYTFAIYRKKYDGAIVNIVSILSRPNANTRGTIVAIENFDVEKYKEKFAMFVPKKLIVTTIKGGPGEYDDCKIRQAFRLPGEIYVRDIYVEKLKKGSLFGYNFWFNNKTSNYLSPDRENLTASPKSLAREFVVFLDQDEFVLELMIAYEHAGHYKQTGYLKYYLESMILDYINENNLTVSEKIAKSIHRSIKIAFDLNDEEEYSWSDNDPDSRKVLEHLGVIDMASKLPDISGILADYGLIKSVDQWAKLEDIKLVKDITPEIFREYMTKQYGTKVGLEAERLLVSITKVFEDIAKDYTGSKLFWFVKPTTLPSREIDRIGGFANRADFSIWFQLNALTKTYYPGQRHIARKSRGGSERIGYILNLFIHEFAHTLCYKDYYDCSDLGENFENFLTISGMIVRQELTPEREEILVDSIVKLSNIFNDSDIDNISQSYMDTKLPESIRRVLKAAAGSKCDRSCRQEVYDALWDIMKAPYARSSENFDLCLPLLANRKLNSSEILEVMIASDNKKLMGFLRDRLQGNRRGLLDVISVLNNFLVGYFLKGYYVYDDEEKAEWERHSKRNYQIVNNLSALYDMVLPIYENYSGKIKEQALSVLCLTQDPRGVNAYLAILKSDSTPVPYKRILLRSICRGFPLNEIEETLQAIIVKDTLSLARMAIGCIASSNSPERHSVITRIILEDSVRESLRVYAASHVKDPSAAAEIYRLTNKNNIKRELIDVAVELFDWQWENFLRFAIRSRNNKYVSSALYVAIRHLWYTNRGLSLFDDVLEATKQDDDFSDSAVILILATNAFWNPAIVAQIIIDFLKNKSGRHIIQLCKVKVFGLRGRNQLIFNLLENSVRSAIKNALSYDQFVGLNKDRHIKKYMVKAADIIYKKYR